MSMAERDSPVDLGVKANRVGFIEFTAEDIFPRLHGKITDANTASHRARACVRRAREKKDEYTRRQRERCKLQVTLPSSVAKPEDDRSTVRSALRARPVPPAC